MEISNFTYEISKVALTVLTAYILYFYYKYFTRENPLPGPFPLPLIGNTHQVLKHPTFKLRKLQDKYGDLCEFYIGPRRFILLSNYDLIRKVLKSTINGPFHNRVNDDNDGLKEIGLLNTGMFYNNNFDDWQYHNKFLVRVMMSPSFIKQSLISVKEIFSVMENFWDELGEDTVLELNYWMKYYFFDTIHTITTSKSIHALEKYYMKLAPGKKSIVPESDLKVTDGFIEAADALVASALYFYIFPSTVRSLPGLKGYTQYLKEKVHMLRVYVDKIVKAKREEISKIPIDQELTPDLLTMFLTVNTERDITERIADDQHGEPMSDKVIEENFIEVMSGAIDTSSNSMCFLVHLIENHPSVKRKMIEEIERFLGKDPNSSFTLDDLSKLEYVDAVIVEASRYYTIGPTFYRKNSTPEVIGGYKWSEGTNFGINYDGIHNHKSYWKDPETFNPDRFIDDPQDKSKVYTYGGGLRICPGRNLAKMELKATLTMLYQKYDIELKGHKEYITMIRNCELKVRMRKKTSTKHCD